MWCDDSGSWLVDECHRCAWMGMGRLSSICLILCFAVPMLFDTMCIPTAGLMMSGWFWCCLFNSNSAKKAYGVMDQGQNPSTDNNPPPPERYLPGDNYAFQMIRANLFRTIVRIIQDVCANHPLLKEGSRLFAQGVCANHPQANNWK